MGRGGGGGGGSGGATASGATGRAPSASASASATATPGTSASSGNGGGGGGGRGGGGGGNNVPVGNKAGAQGGVGRGGGVRPPGRARGVPPTCNCSECVAASREYDRSLIAIDKLDRNGFTSTVPPSGRANNRSRSSSQSRITIGVSVEGDSDYLSGSNSCETAEDTDAYDDSNESEGCPASETTCREFTRVWSALQEMLKNGGEDFARQFLNRHKEAPQTCQNGCMCPTRAQWQIQCSAAVPTQYPQYRKCERTQYSECKANNSNCGGTTSTARTSGGGGGSESNASVDMSSGFIVVPGSIEEAKKLSREKKFALKVPACCGPLPSHASPVTNKPSSTPILSRTITKACTSEMRPQAHSPVVIPDDEGYWLELQNLVGSIFKDPTCPTTREQLERGLICTCKLCNINPVSLFLKLENKAVSWMQHLRSHLVQFISSSAPLMSQSNATDFVTLVGASFESITKASQVLDPVLEPLYTHFLIQFNINFGDVIKGLFHHIVFDDAIVQTVLPQVKSLLGDGSTTKQSTSSPAPASDTPHIPVQNPKESSHQPVPTTSSVPTLPVECNRYCHIFDGIVSSALKWTSNKEVLQRYLAQHQHTVHKTVPSPPSCKHLRQHHQQIPAELPHSHNHSIIHTHHQPSSPKQGQQSQAQQLQVQQSQCSTLPQETAQQSNALASHVREHRRQQQSLHSKHQSSPILDKVVALMQQQKQLQQSPQHHSHKLAAVIHMAEDGTPETATDPLCSYTAEDILTIAANVWSNQGFFITPEDGSITKEGQNLIATSTGVKAVVGGQSVVLTQEGDDGNYVYDIEEYDEGEDGDEDVEDDGDEGDDEDEEEEEYDEEEDDDDEEEEEEEEDEGEAEVEDSKGPLEEYIDKNGNTIAQCEQLAQNALGHTNNPNQTPPLEDSARDGSDEGYQTEPLPEDYSVDNVSEKLYTIKPPKAITKGDGCRRCNSMSCAYCALSEIASPYQLARDKLRQKLKNSKEQKKSTAPSKPPPIKRTDNRSLKELLELIEGTDKTKQNSPNPSGKAKTKVRQPAQSKMQDKRVNTVTAQKTSQKSIKTTNSTKETQPAKTTKQSAQKRAPKSQLSSSPSDTATEKEEATESEANTDNSEATRTESTAESDSDNQEEETEDVQETDSEQQSASSQSDTSEDQMQTASESEDRSSDHEESQDESDLEEVEEEKETDEDSENIAIPKKERTKGSEQQKKQVKGNPPRPQVSNKDVAKRDSRKNTTQPTPPQEPPKNKSSKNKGTPNSNLVVPPSGKKAAKNIETQHNNSTKKALPKQPSADTPTQQPATKKPPSLTVNAPPSSNPKPGKVVNPKNKPNSTSSQSLLNKPTKASNIPTSSGSVLAPKINGNTPARSSSAPTFTQIPVSTFPLRTLTPALSKKAPASSQAQPPSPILPTVVSVAQPKPSHATQQPIVLPEKSASSLQAKMAAFNGKFPAFWANCKETSSDQPAPQSTPATAAIPQVPM
ncbi:hypothetical protein Pelo_4298 [Pelomyxa schiedti]|nr:hypothetical protein Pelo_4298 [Pelomyxa schiedti]